MAYSRTLCKPFHKEFAGRLLSWRVGRRSDCIIECCIRLFNIVVLLLFALYGIY